MIVKINDQLTQKEKIRRENTETIAQLEFALEYLKEQVKAINARREQLRDLYKEEVTRLKQLSEALVRLEDEQQFYEDQVEQAFVKQNNQSIENP